MLLAILPATAVIHSIVLVLTWGSSTLFHIEEALLEGDVQRSNRPFLLSILLEIVDGAPMAHSVGTRTRIIIVVSVYSSQTLQVTDYLYSMLIQ